tara:strand:- start:8208 stop:8534 length:327 start_codon:yes stop_codon:yes gene_type:complete
MILKDIFMRLFYHKKKKEAKMINPKKMGDNEKSIKLLINTLEALAIRYKPFLEMCPTETAFGELQNLLVQNIELLLVERQHEAITCLIKEGKARPVTNHWYIIKGKKA